VIALILLALIASVFFGVGFTVHWLFVARGDSRPPDLRVGQGSGRMRAP
jgi:hypothetical protein